jgi:hypothetical protein
LILNKKLIVGFALSAVYIVMSLTGIAGLDAGARGIFYRIIIIAALLLSCFPVFREAVKSKGGIILAGALGLGLLAVNEVYSFAYIYLGQGGAEDITVSNFSRPCAYLFFILAVTSLYPSFMKTGKGLKTGVGIVSTIAALIIFYGVIANQPSFLYYSALAIAILCALSAVFLLFGSVRNHKIFACSILAVCLLDSANRLLIIYTPGWLWRDIVIALYPTAYLWFGAVLLSLKKKEGGGEHGRT